MRLCFSEKQKRVLRWWNRGSPDAGKDAILCDGAVRSGKTLCLGLSFVLWSMTRFQRQQFALCGKTTESVRRNLLSSVLPVLEGLGFTWEEKLSRNWMKIRCGGVENTYFLFGGKDEGERGADPRGDPGGGAAGRGGADAPLLCGAGLCPVLCDGGKILVLLQPGGAGALVLSGVDLQGPGAEPAPPAVLYGGQPHPVPGNPAAV